MKGKIETIEFDIQTRPNYTSNDFNVFSSNFEKNEIVILILERGIQVLECLLKKQSLWWVLHTLCDEHRGGKNCRPTGYAYYRLQDRDQGKDCISYLVINDFEKKLNFFIL